MPRNFIGIRRGEYILKTRLKLRVKEITNGDYYIRPGNYNCDCDEIYLRLENTATGIEYKLSLERYEEENLRLLIDFCRDIKWAFGDDIYGGGNKVKNIFQKLRKNKTMEILEELVNLSKKKTIKQLLCNI